MRLHQVTNTTTGDLDEIYRFFDQSVEYQTRNNRPDWKGLDRNVIAEDMRHGNQYKIQIEQDIAIVFSVRYDDKVIWRSKDKGDAIYLHRIVVNPAFKGQKLFGEILAWAVEKCKASGLQYVRMDTWANNPQLIKYYQGFGFEFIENYTTPDSADLPAHNRRLALALLEYRV
jgi:ribosomal protein S18 acetylase RimI-like enzyme